ncbi:sorting and assembly machinery component 50 homolog [Tribolium castaneum]|uniref:SAM50-like protein CG7639 n=1 Tax=Tribolium castaneum TaxID=7070 RepID=A0A139WGS8_TRICA|nr:PREDICTED: sorting and assembly machinery component 50 homolog [Tribolium castaneum]KYB27071.1 SAM50-like protein CG7639 [Tribolium castaneum]|eukprot:XP_966817.2 PREDICTED: sorting and assembly machinery component 50 homolog [Tribolium castaneum]
MGTVHAKSEENAPILPTIPQEHIKSEPAQHQDQREIFLDGVKARVDKIHVDGLARTKDDIIEDCIRDLFKAADFQDVLLRAHRARLKLDELGCFKNIAVFIDTSKGQGASPDGLEVTFNVTEHKRVTGGVTTQVGNNEGALLIGLRAPNLFGRGERVQLEYSHGSKRTTNFNVAFIKPMRGKYRPMFTTSVFQSNAEWPVSGYKQLDRGLLFDFGFHSTALIKHNIQWEAAIRDLAVLSRNTSFEVREQAGLSLKSALRHIISIDLRDDLIFPTSGSLLQLTSEVAGLGGDVGFLKNEFFIQGNYSLVEDFVLQGTLSGGFMRGLSNDMKIGMSDMYYLGGPLTLRGFQMRGVGPHSEGDALGSMAYWASGLHLFSPLPFRPGRGGFGDLFKTHLFITAGNVGDFSLSDKNLIDSLTASVRISYGVGIALRLGNMARVEVNYCFPHTFEKGDQIHPGIQFGIGVQFV